MVVSEKDSVKSITCDSGLSCPDESQSKPQPWTGSPGRTAGNTSARDQLSNDTYRKKFNFNHHEEREKLFQLPVRLSVGDEHVVLGGGLGGDAVLLLVLALGDLVFARVEVVAVVVVPLVPCLLLAVVGLGVAAEAAAEGGGDVGAEVGGDLVTCLLLLAEDLAVAGAETAQ